MGQGTDQAATSSRASAVLRLDIVLPCSADGASFAAYQAASAAHVAISLPDGASPSDFFIDGATWQLPHATLTRVRCSPQVITRGENEIARDDAPTIQLYLQVAGEVVGTCEGRPERFGPGDAVVRDSRRGQQDTATAFDVRILMMARERVPLALLSPAVHGLRLPGEQAGTRLLFAAVEALVGAMDDLSPTEADHAVAALFLLAAGLVEAEQGRRDRTRRRFADPQLDAAMAFIEHGFNDAGLDAEAVRAHVGLSRTKLYALFRPLGGIDGVIRTRRLDAAMRALLTDAGPAPGLAELTARHGFRNEVHFARAFRARFGVPPGRFRQKIASGDRAWLAEQAGRAGFASLEAWLGALATGEVGGEERREGNDGA